MNCLFLLLRRATAGALLLALWIACAGASWSQEQALPRVSVAAGDGPAAVPGTWGSLQLIVTNPREEHVDLLCLTYLENEKALQFGRRIWLPPHARLRIRQPLHLPQPADAKAAAVEYHTQLYELGASGEVLLPDNSGRMVRDGALSLGLRTKATGVIDTREPSPEGEEAANAVYEMVLAARGQTVQTLRTSFLYESPLPLYGEESLEALDCLVIADSRLLAEPAALAAVRRWLYGGGRLWVLLDQVDAQVLEGLLGDDFACHVVDRVGLTQVQIDAGPAGAKVGAEAAAYEQPVELARVVAEGIDVMYTVQGWPAALMKPCGDGQLLVTTLGPAGWLRSTVRPARNPPSGAVGPPAALPPTNSRQAATALRNLAADFFSDPRPPLLPTNAVEPVVREYIGYGIPPAWLVVGLLGLFNVVLVGAGGALWRFSRLDGMRYVIPGVALSLSAILVAVGAAHRQGIPPTVARLQFVQVIPGTDEQRVSGIAGLFSPSTLPAPLAGTHGGWSELRLPEGQLPTRRLVWTDHDTWQWENVRQPAGLQIATFRSSLAASPRVEARATVGPEGLTGKLVGTGERPAEDAMVVTRDGRIGVDLKGDGTFSARADGVMSHGQFVGANLLSDEQNRRQRVLAELLAGNERFDFPDRPHLFFWTPQWDTGIEFGQQLRPIGSTLVAVPLVFSRPAAGIDITIPSPLVSYRAVAGPDGTATTGLYDYRRRQWLERSRPSWVWLKFQVPQLLLPLEPASARLVIEVTGPVRQLEIAAFHDGNLVPLQTWQNPVGTLTASVTEPQYLKLASDGTFLLRIAGGGPIDSDSLSQTPSLGSKASYWQIESLRLDLRGKVLAASNAISPSATKAAP